MANNLGGLVDKFTTRLDQVVEQESKTSFLNLNGELLGELNGHGQIEIATIALDGLGDYDRANGFPTGSVSLEWEQYKLQHDRGREFEIDDMDDEEHLSLVTANAMSIFARDKVVPEVDAIRFATLAQNAGEQESADITTAAGALAAVLTAEEAMQDAGEELDGLVLNLTSHMHTLLRNSQEWQARYGEDPDTRVRTFDGMRLSIIPRKRFYSAVELYDGKTSGEEAGGYAKAGDYYAPTKDTSIVSGKTYYTESGGTYSAVSNPSGNPSALGYYEKLAGKNLNFLIASPKAAAAITKHQKLRYFAPDVNQDKDAHKWQYRLYHDLLVYKHQVDKIYAHIATL